MSQDPSFKRVYIEITNVCNQNCPFCPKTTRKPQFLTLGEFKTILGKLKGHTKHLYFHVLGEPLLHPELSLFLDEAHDQGFWVNLVTNGALIGKAGPFLLQKPALRQISFSLHSLAHQGEQETQKRLGEILSFIDAATETEIYCSLRLWTGGISDNQVVLAGLKSHFSPEVRLNLLFSSEVKRGLKLRDRVFLNPADEFAWPSIDAPRQKGQAFCHGLKQQIAILVDGTVVPCCLDGEGVINLGNLFAADLFDIWHSSRAQTLLQGFSRGEAVEELCRRCGYRTRFNK